VSAKAQASASTLKAGTTSDVRHAQCFFTTRLSVSV